jgi:hypothetical protein
MTPRATSARHRPASSERAHIRTALPADGRSPVDGIGYLPPPVWSATTGRGRWLAPRREVVQAPPFLREWAANWNENPKPFVWHKSADEILQRLAGYCSAINTDENISASS